MATLGFEVPFGATSPLRGGPNQGPPAVSPASFSSSPHSPRDEGFELPSKLQPGEIQQNFAELAINEDGESNHTIRKVRAYVKIRCAVLKITRSLFSPGNREGSANPNVMAYHLKNPAATAAAYNGIGLTSSVDLLHPSPVGYPRKCCVCSVESFQFYKQPSFMQ